MLTPTDRGPSRFSPAAYASAIYLLAVGLALVLLSYRLEPARGKDYLHGVLFGLLLMFLASPLLFIARLPIRIAAPTALLSSVLWTVAFATVALLFFPMQTLGLAIEGMSESTRPLVVFLLGIFIWIGVHILVSGAVQAILDFIIASIALLRRLAPAQILRAVVIGLVPAAVVIIVASLQDAAAWGFPPLTFDPRISGSVLIVGALVATVARTRETWSAGAVDRHFAPTRPHPITAYLLATELAWVGIAPVLAPHGWPPPKLAIYAPERYASLAHDGVTEEALADTEGRTGVSAASDRILVIYRDPDGTRFTSRHDFYPDSNILISIDGTVSEARRRYVLRFQIGNAILQNAVPGLPGPLRVGYSYWAARNEQDPFQTGIRSGQSPAAACSDIPEIDFGVLSDEAITLDSAPFEVAEREFGLAGAQALFRELAFTPFDVSVWTERVKAACSAFISRYAGPPLPAVRVEPSGVPAPDDSVVDILNEVKARTGMDARGRPFVIRYQSSLPNNLWSTSTFSDDGTVVVSVSLALAQATRKMTIAAQFAAAFVVIKYGNGYEPLRGGFAEWAARDPGDPFVSQDKPSASTLCASREKYPLDGPTLGGIYLSSLPFAMAERRGGVGAAQRLVKEVAAIGGQLDLGAWNRRVAESCSAWTAASPP